MYEQYQNACQKVIPSAFKKERTSRNKNHKKNSKHNKKEDFKVKLSTTAAYKIKPLFKIRQGSGFLSKMSTKANMVNFKILQSLF